MGKPKLLLPWANTSILGHLVEQWEKLGAEQIAVVCAIGDPVIHEELDRLRFSSPDRIENPVPQRGMFSSVQCAARWPGWKQTLTHWALILGDQPHLRQETLKTVVELAAADPGKVVQPTHAGHRRHPVLLSKPIFFELQHSKTGNLKEFLVNYEVVVAECDDPGLDLDLDRPQDYKKALALIEERHRSADASSDASSASDHL
jgi:molybdenum cofactor cytidylyltransferase